MNESDISAIISTIRHGEKDVIFKFRDIEKEIDQVKLKAFCLSENVN